MMATALAIAFALTLVPAAQGHGYVRRPSSRAYLCTMWANRDCGAVVYEPQSIEAAKGFPVSGPADGSIAGGGQFGKLDEAGPDRWRHVNLRKHLHRVNSTHYSIVFKWYYSAPHRTTKYDLFATRRGYDGSEPLSRAVLKHVHTRNSPSKQALPIVQHYIPRKMVHKVGALLCVWVIDDTSNAFYQVIDYKLRSKSRKKPQRVTTDERSVKRKMYSSTLASTGSANSSRSSPLLRQIPCEDTRPCKVARVIRPETELCDGAVCRSAAH